MAFWLFFSRVFWIFQLFLLTIEFIWYKEIRANGPQIFIITDRWLFLSAPHKVP